MKITLDWLKERGACSEGTQWFVSQTETELGPVIKALIKDQKFEWANWTLTSVLSHKQNVQYACYSAKQSLHLFEKQFPNDKRPRFAIEAALKCAKYPTAQNRSAAASAARSAGSAAGSAESAARSAARSAAWSAARSAAWSAGSAAWSAESAARSAARSAAWSAESAAWSAARSAAWSAGSAAWSAASAARSAGSPARKRILKYGLKLATEKGK